MDTQVVSVRDGTPSRAPRRDAADHTAAVSYLRLMGRPAHGVWVDGGRDGGPGVIMAYGEGALTDHRRDKKQFSDEEMAFLRHAEFGELPPRIAPEQRAELTETAPRRDLPEPEPWDAQWYAGG
jgi:hypothetical protein